MRLLGLIIIAGLIMLPQVSKAAPYGTKDMMEILEKAPKPGPKPKTYTLKEVKKSHTLRRRLHGVNINTVNFRFDSDRIEDNGDTRLRRLANALLNILDRRPYEVFLIEGHTDAVGSQDYNRYLSEDRARAVRRFLVRRYGVPAHALETAGYGEQFLAVRVPTEERRNRRVTVRRVTDFVRPRGRRPYAAYDTYYAPPPRWARRRRFRRYPPPYWD